MVNQSKINDPRFWAKWRTSGAVDTIEDSIARQLAKEGKLTVVAIGEHYQGPVAGHSTLSLGERLVNSGHDWEVREPVLYVVAPGLGYKLGEQLKKLPRGSAPLREYFANA